MKKMALVYGKNNQSKNHFKTKCHDDIFLLASTYMMSQQYIFDKSYLKLLITYQGVFHQNDNI